MQVMGAISSVGALGAAAMGVGIAQAAVHHTRNQVLERAIAGQRLADNPVVLCQFADMLTETNAARALLHQAIWDKENSPPGPISTIFQAKVYATEVAQRVVDRAIQLHGMYGYSRELPLEKLWRDGRVLTIHFGTSDVLRAMASKVALGLFP